jgi:hypothetical protein
MASGFAIAAVLFATVFPDRLASIFAGEEAALRYVALGDSITKGEYGDGSPGFAERYRDYARAGLGEPLALTNLGVNSLTSTALLELVKTDPTFREAIAAADLFAWPTSTIR